MKTSSAVPLILLVSGVITVIMVVAEMNTIGYVFHGRSSATSFLPLVFGIVMSIVVASLKKDEIPEETKQYRPQRTKSNNTKNNK